MLIFKCIFIFMCSLKVFANCEFSVTNVDFHTVANYANTIQLPQVTYIDNVPFMTGIKKVYPTLLHGIQCKSFLPELFEGDIEERNVLKLGGCDQSSLQNIKIALTPSAITKYEPFSVIDINVSKIDLAKFVADLKRDKVLDSVIFAPYGEAEPDGYVVINGLTEGLKYTVKEGRQFKHGKVIIEWFVLAADLVFQANVIDKVAIEKNRQEGILSSEFQTKPQTVKDQAYISVYKLNDKYFYFGNGAYNDCGLIPAFKQRETTEPIILPKFLPTAIYYLSGANDTLIIEQYNLSWAYEWNLLSKKFEVINKPNYFSRHTY